MRQKLGNEKYIWYSLIVSEFVNMIVGSVSVVLPKWHWNVLFGGELWKVKPKLGKVKPTLGKVKPTLGKVKPTLGKVKNCSYSCSNLEF